MTLLQNRYLLGEELGRGAFGKTYLATDTHSPSNRKCVVKELIWSGDPEMADQVRERFRREAILLESLGRDSQGGIPELYAYFSENERHYLVQEWIDGETLTQKLKREGPQTEAATVHLLLGALRVLDYIHTGLTPIIHRDIKPDNIMLRRATGQVVLIDFGVVKEVTHTDGYTMQTGTRGYMPPEQVVGRPTFASDLYALAMTAITYATGRHPHSLANQDRLELDWRGMAPEISPALADLLDRAIRYDPQERFSSARAFALAIIQTLRLPASEANDWLAPSRSTNANVSRATDPLPFTQLSATQPAGGFLDSPTIPLLSVPSSPSNNPSIPPTYRGQPSARQPEQSGPMPSPVSTRLVLPLVSVSLALVLFVGAGLLMWRMFTPALNQSTASSKSTRDESEGKTARPSVAPPDMVLIPGGVFQMGSPSAEDPAHQVTVSSFFIDKYEVTNAAYAAFVKATGHPAPPGWKNGTYPKGKDNHPVGNVSWEDARAYAAWAGKRLPTEAEWEFAARGTEGRRYPWGNEFARWRLNSAEAEVGHTETVGSFPTGATPEGVFDLAGNVAEWTASDDAPYPGSARKPVPGTKIVRGGGFSLPGKYASATKRTQVPPDTRDPALGFRCARDVELPPSKNQ
ncbi:bifunctional serine/threonine-protein kinase/formylglycine-generating enzyme family protein [Chloracidobacterium aggregatum]|uniref:SUMF1/EgtB/PvdO family nonheme iron enzyme n=2 Tax=Chloracidobacterium TaxID=458032 RepID=A0ABX8B1S3_9BACT|nr:bifunctional serine/threonine-protein kinase/formylglycine-generating enzyme family protein [Chloracidobacterium aggregatum]QUV83938.1 SUMF1/EgtB/PvdO family nonheme iron enzyme [Chloracidobacterium sp. 2]QUV87579.1 SUMF1/EgtB/PvdO family nonheme iron enzyme [Chloracidobacterium sp. S]QUV93690.1 SUMF1/EgtB/PvdO family nonheme iron enzyme [Chloracidobacterium sp. N]QUV96845.1 SUMF1/EgtB/PvdO family nonheme iron enzyme [Chloracidobacterium sp. E]